MPLSFSFRFSSKLKCRYFCLSGTTNEFLIQLSWTGSSRISSCGTNLIKIPTGLEILPIPGNSMTFGSLHRHKHNHFFFVISVQGGKVHEVIPIHALLIFISPSAWYMTIIHSCQFCLTLVGIVLNLSERPSSVNVLELPSKF